MFLILVPLAASMARAEQILEPAGDPELGKIVYRSYCANCHGWAADGKTGVNLRSPTGSNIRETKLVKDGLMEVVKCGIPGTAMPYHDRAAYRDDRCYGLVMSDLGPSSKPTRGKTFGNQKVANVVAYLQAYVIGLGKPTFKECIDYFDNPAARACSSLKSGRDD